MTKELCIICNKNEADYENIICQECKRKHDEMDFEEERKAFMADMVGYSHRGEWCWLTGKTFCQEGWCECCQLYLDWKKSLEEVSAK